MTGLGNAATCELALVTVMLGAMAITSAYFVREESVTADESIHIAAGLSYLDRRDARLNLEHPPLIKVAAALPLILCGARIPVDHPAWRSPQDAMFGAALLQSWGNAGESMITAARIPMIVVTLLLGLTVFYIARSLGGRAGGLLALAAFVSSPFNLAYGPLVITDIGIALFALLTGWTFASMCHRPDRVHLAVFVLSLSGALLTKFSAGLLFPALTLLIGWNVARPLCSQQSTRRVLVLSLTGVLLAALVVYLTYGVLFWNTDVAWLLSYRFSHSTRPLQIMQATSVLLQAHPWLNKLSGPAVLYSLGVGSTVHALVRPTYLLGQIYPHGTPYYFPALFGLKMTEGFLALAALSCVMACFARPSWWARAQKIDTLRSARFRAIVAVLLVFTGAALLSPLNLGIRHLSVPITAITVLLGNIAPLSQAVQSRRLGKAAVVLAIFAVLESSCTAAKAFPNYISYFNIFAGNHKYFKIAVDSNLDWGQSLIQVRKFMAAHHIQDIGLDVKGSLPELYIPQARTFECELGAPAGAGWVAVSADRFVGWPTLSASSAGSVERCTYLFRYPHWLASGGAVYIFRLSGDGDISGQMEAKADSAARRRSERSCLQRRCVGGGYGQELRACDGCL